MYFHLRYPQHCGFHYQINTNRLPVLTSAVKSHVCAWRTCVCVGVCGLCIGRTVATYVLTCKNVAEYLY